MTNYIEEKFIERFKDTETLSKEELFDFYLQFRPDMNDGALRWRIYDLKKKNIIKQVKRGVYTLSGKPDYRPGISKMLIRLSKILKQKFDGLDYCAWNTSWLNEFSKHQAITNINFIEIEKELVESVFYELKESGFDSVYLDPDESTIQLYIVEKDEPISIKPIISRAPLHYRTIEKTKVFFPSLEKILVDLFSEEAAFYYLQGAERETIFENAINRYNINFSSLFTYAGRRGKAIELKNYLMKNLGHSLKDIVK